MPRVARTVFKNIPHHITQRGNRREVVFYGDNDREIYLKWLKEYVDKYRVKLLAYCLMDNHIHLILQPSTEEGLQRVLKPLHMRYAQRINKQKGWKGHLWQGRFFSSPMDSEYLLACIRYIERNPVRAGIVDCAEDYLWSSAAEHGGQYEVGLLSKLTKQQRPVLENEWAQWLSEGDDLQKMSVIRRNIEKGLPCGGERFVRKLEAITGISLGYRPQGRPKLKG